MIQTFTKKFCIAFSIIIFLVSITIPACVSSSNNNTSTEVALEYIPDSEKLDTSLKYFVSPDSQWIIYASYEGISSAPTYVIYGVKNQKSQILNITSTSEDNYANGFYPDGWFCWNESLTGGVFSRWNKAPFFTVLKKDGVFEIDVVDDPRTLSLHQNNCLTEDPHTVYKELKVVYPNEGNVQIVDKASDQVLVMHQRRLWKNRVKIEENSILFSPNFNYVSYRLSRSFEDIASSSELCFGAVSRNFTPTCVNQALNPVWSVDSHFLYFYIYNKYSYQGKGLYRIQIGGS